MPYFAANTLRSCALFLVASGCVFNNANAIGDEPATKPAIKAESKADRDLMRAITHSNVDAVAKSLKEGISANDRIYGDMPLSVAAGHASLDIAKLFLDHGANVDSDNHWGCTALYCAVYARNNAMVKLLLDHGAKSQLDDSLRHAAFAGEADIVRMLIDRHANLNVREINGETPLYQAASEGHKEVILILLEAGADASIGDKNGETPVAVAKKSKHPETADLIANYKVKPTPAK